MILHNSCAHVSTWLALMRDVNHLLMESLEMILKIEIPLELKQKLGFTAC